MPAASPMPTVENSTGDSPKELIAAYLQKQGMPLTNANYALALKANSDNPGTIAGLANMEPVVSAGDPGFVGPVAPRGGGGRPLPVPPIPPPGGAPPIRTGETVISTPPEGMSLSDIVALMLGGGAAGAARWLKPATPTPDGKLPAAPIEGQRALPAPEKPLLLEGPRPGATGDAPPMAGGAPRTVDGPPRAGYAAPPMGGPAPPPPPNPIAAAIDRALAPAATAVAPATAGAPPLADAVPPPTPAPEPTVAERFQKNIGGGGVGGKKSPKVRARL